MIVQCKNNLSGNNVCYFCNRITYFPLSTAKASISSKKRTEGDTALAFLKIYKKQH